MNKYEAKIGKVETWLSKNWRKATSKVKLTNENLALRSRKLKNDAMQELKDRSVKATFESKDRELIELRQQMVELKSDHKLELEKKQILLDEMTLSAQTWHDKYIKERHEKAKYFEDLMRLKESNKK